MEQLIIATVFFALGVFCMRLSNNHAEKVRRSERSVNRAREAMDRGELRIMSEKRAAVEAENNRLKQEAAHNAGWHEGYQTAQREFCEKEQSDGIVGLINSSLQEGRSVAVGFGKR